MKIHNHFGPKGFPGGVEDIVAPRCATCNTPVRPHRNDPCKCFPVVDSLDKTDGDDDADKDDGVQLPKKPTVLDSKVR